LRKSYFCKCLNENKEDPKRLNNIINKLTGKNVTPILPRHGSDKEIAEKMSDFLIEKVKNIRKEIETGIINTDDSGNEITCPVRLDILQKIDEKELNCIVNEMKS
jgi:hypothetical protein